MSRRRSKRSASLEENVRSRPREQQPAVPLSRPNRTDSYLIQGRREKSPLEQVSQDIADYESEYGLSRTVHASIAVLLDHGVDLIHDQHEKKPRVEGALRKLIGEELEMENLVATTTTFGVVGQKMAAIRWLTKLSQVNFAKAVCNDYVKRLSQY